MSDSVLQATPQNEADPTAQSSMFGDHSYDPTWVELASRQREILRELLGRFMPAWDTGRRGACLNDYDEIADALMYTFSRGVFCDLKDTLVLSHLEQAFQHVTITILLRENRRR